MSKLIFIENLKVEQELTDFFMAKEIAIKMGSNKKYYLDVTLADNSGEINGKKWDVPEDEFASLERIKAGDLVKIKGVVTEWNNTKQLKILRIRKGQKEDGLAFTDFIKAAPEDPQDMYAYILSKAQAIGDDGLRAMALTFLTENKERLLY